MTAPTNSHMIRVRLVPGTTGAALHRAAANIPRRLYTLVRLILEHDRTNTIQETPVGWSGQLRGGYQVDVLRLPHGARGALLNPTAHHDIRDQGRHAGRRPPVSALIPWVGSKLGIPEPARTRVAFLVARKIGAKGYRGAHMVDKGWAKTLPEITPALAKLGWQIVSDIDSAP